MKARTALYRFFDADEVLLYVGITENPHQRWLAHKSQKSWWRDVAGKTVEWHGDRTAAETAERVAIRQERPLYNIRDAVIRPRGRITPVEITEFWKYVERVSDGAPTTEIAGRIGGGIAQSTVSRWKETVPKIQSVVALATVYGQDPLEALVVAGYITEDDRQEPLAPPVDLTRVGDDDLLAEVARRMKR